MARIFDEKFEATGYDESGWTESVGSGCTIDEDAATSTVSSPSGWGSKCLKLIGAAAKTNYAYNQIGNSAVRYTRIEAIFTDLSNLTSSGACSYIGFATNNALSVFCWILRAVHDGTNIKAQILVYYDGSAVATSSGPTLEEDTRYRFEVKWDGGRFDWKVNGISYTGGDLQSGYAQMGAIVLGGAYTTDVVAATTYLDLVAIDGADWVGAEPSSFVPRITRF